MFRYFLILNIDDRTFCPPSTGLYQEWFKYNGHCYHYFGLNVTYYVYDGERTWDEARAYCASQGGDLMSIESQEEEDTVLWQVAPSTYLYRSFWIGLKRKVDANGEEYPADYEWADGTQTDFQHFQGTQI